MRKVLEIIAAIAEREGLRWLLIGGHAVGMHGYERATLDVDIVVPESEGERWLQALRAAGFTDWSRGDRFHRVQAPGGPPVDCGLLGDASFAQMERSAIRGERLGVPNLPAPHVAHLMRMKLHAIGQAQGRRGWKDVPDLIEIAARAGIDLLSPEWLPICRRYAGEGFIAQLRGAAPPDDDGL